MAFHWMRILLPPRDSNSITYSSSCAQSVSFTGGFAQSPSLRQARQILKDKGYYTAAVDGMNGPGTRQALSKYQKDQGIPVTGKLDAATTGKLMPSGPGDTVNSAPGSLKSQPPQQPASRRIP